MPTLYSSRRSRHRPIVRRPREVTVAAPSQRALNVKFLMRVKRRFWRDEGIGATMTADGPVNITWEGTERQGGLEADLTAFSGGPDAETCRAWPEGERDMRHVAVLPAPGEVTTVGPWLHRGLGSLHFAGEHTCYAFVGYMEGALNSGLRVAWQIVARDR